jgi:HD-like signal output (HDOD) protein
MISTGPNGHSSSDLEWRKIRYDAITSLKSFNLPDDLQTPSLPSALTKFLDVSSGAEYDIATLGRIVEVDPGMTMDLLKWVNVAAAGTERPIKSATAALIRMGVPKARNYLIAAGMRGATLAYESRLVNHRNFWNESLRRAIFAQQTAKVWNFDADLAFIGGLLQDFALPGLTNQFDTQYVEFLKDAAPDGVLLTDWERNTFGWDHAAVGAYVAHQWNMPEDLLCAILFHHRMDLTLQATGGDLPQLFPVALAGLLPDQLQQVPDGIQRLLDADAKSSVFRLGELCDAVDSQLAILVEGDDAPLRLAPAVQNAREIVSA